MHMMDLPIVLICDTLSVQYMHSRHLIGTTSSITAMLCTNTQQPSSKGRTAVLMSVPVLSQGTPVVAGLLLGPLGVVLDWSGAAGVAVTPG
jgi:hypothetical protein